MLAMTKHVPASDLPKHLAGTLAQGMTPGSPVAQFEIGDMRNFVYLVLDWQSRKAVIIDPQRDLSLPMQSLAQHGFLLEAILLTHTHSDHTAGLPELLMQHPELPVVLHPSELYRIKRHLKHGGVLRELKDGEFFQLGSTSIQLLHTPGHSAGEVCYLVQGDRPYLFTGDTIFIRDCGRTDLDTGNNDDMFASIQKIKGLPPNTVILPGHHYAPECASTLEREIQESPPLRCRSVEELAALP